uniref:Uncharacterized protein n=1 Tax=Helianthus annuus TaxID=4232 RepID=A0A251T2T1_HELAN
MISFLRSSSQTRTRITLAQNRSLFLQFHCKNQFQITPIHVSKIQHHMFIILKMMFEAEVGIGLLHLYMKNLQPSMLLVLRLSIFFASMLNYEEVKRT